MGKYLALMLLLASSSLWASGGGPWWEYLVQAEGGLRMREGPGTDFPVVTLIPDGAYVRDVHGMLYETLPAARHWEANDGNWTLVAFSGEKGVQSGWVHNDYLRVPETSIADFGCATLIRVPRLKTMNPEQLAAQIPRPFVLAEHDINVVLSNSSAISLIRELQSWDLDRWESDGHGACRVFSGQNERGRLRKQEYTVLGKKRHAWTLEVAGF